MYPKLILVTLLTFIANTEIESRRKFGDLEKFLISLILAFFREVFFFFLLFFLSEIYIILRRSFITFLNAVAFHPVL
jgi:hypothetical protein